MPDLRAALTAASAHGMRIQQVPGRPDLVRMFCATCGWPEDHREVILERWLEDPQPCHPCAWEKRHGVTCPGFGREAA